MGQAEAVGGGGLIRGQVVPGSGVATDGAAAVRSGVAGCSNRET
jgi:hypothetical protein